MCDFGCVTCVTCVPGCVCVFLVEVVVVVVARAVGVRLAAPASQVIT